ncbi:hypothetical protein BFJ65_g18231 [Fusarium oxysporum f. sp. cepae]|uniref:Uncharacterized protein n=1 Tax=Fusarium oxysporum f. sp. cepae TaxID=396571 RepID=A0A3L6MRR4_FUSOX|nr:hypothetical protein BFJ65_g18231 [Fusarium oxysporum f. sp. cepae]
MRLGYLPYGLREKLLREAWEGIDSSSDSGLAMPIEGITPLSCDEDTSRLEAYVKDDMAEKKIPASSRKRKRETEEDKGGGVKRRRTTGD